MNEYVPTAEIKYAANAERQRKRGKGGEKTTGPTAFCLVAMPNELEREALSLSMNQCT